MRKTVSLLAALLALSLLLAGCGSGNSGGSGAGNGGGSGAGYAEDGYAEGRMGDTMHTCFFDYTVNSAYLCDEYEGYAPADGNELLVADITVKNTSTSTIPMWDSDFQAQWNDYENEDAYSYPVTAVGDAISDEQLPGEYELGINEERTGLLVYEVPAGERDFSISTMEFFDDETVGDTFFVYFSASKQS